MITISRRYFPSALLSLLHFDYPYYNEAGDGLRDEISAFSWSRRGSVKLVGSEAPADTIITGTPKFGYRCLQSTTNSDYISSSSSAWSLVSGNAYEFSCWVRPTAALDGNIITLYNGNAIQLLLKLNSSLKLSASCSILGLSLETPSALTLNTWQFIKLQISGTYAALSVNLTNSAECSITAAAVPCSECRIGGLAGQIDEFMFRNSLTDSMPSIPTQGICKLEDFGGYGSGKLGNVTITSNCSFNTTANINTHPSSLAFTVKDVQTGKFGGFAAGDEVMFINAEGLYEFRTISSASGTNITIDKALSISVNTSTTKILQVPNFNTLTVNSGVTVSPTWTAGAMGLVAFRCKGNCSINGKILTHASGTSGSSRTDSFTLTHAGLADRLLFGRGGAIFITCGGTFSAGSAARLGGSQSGSITYGTSSTGFASGAGYGGSSNGTTDTHKGRVGYSGSYPGIALDATPPGKDANMKNGNKTVQGRSGACIILITKILNVDAAAISTGGGGGNANGNDSYYNTGGGTGFCYIACERMS